MRRNLDAGGRERCLSARCSAAELLHDPRFGTDEPGVAGVTERLLYAVAASILVLDALRAAPFAHQDAPAAACCEAVALEVLEVEINAMGVVLGNVYLRFPLDRSCSCSRRGQWR